MRRIRARLATSLAAGAIAISLNSALLEASDAMGLRTAHGGLLKLVLNAAVPVADLLGLTLWWQGSVVPVTQGSEFQFGFHILVGLLMAIFYAAAVEPVLSGPSWWKGLLYAIAAWLLNAFVVLPLIGEGIAGFHHLSLAGMAAYAAIHTVFFVLMAVLFSSFLVFGVRSATRSPP